ncbi:amidohydrolase [Fodinibius sp. Rm-B-1B1-1]|uniref:amidohydrolase n=1 Tax=Fodinibius alkaliphilus TaxID=3140241 RepID=UPI00315AE269
MPFNIENDLLLQLRELRQKLHSMAEVSGKEHQTAEEITAFLKKANPDNIQTGIGGTGILATYKGENEGPYLLIRCELDGLPIADNIETEYQSKTEGIGHKCGHDGHMAIVCGVAKLLENKRPESGTVSLLFQPAEETGEGAQSVIDDSDFDTGLFDYCFALHNLPGYQKHQIIVKEDTFAAASVGMKVLFKGATAHAAHPEEGNSPALAVAQTIQAFSAIPQFYVPLEEAAKVTVIHANVGEEAFGTSPGEGGVMATLRTYDDALLEKLKNKCIKIVEGYAQTHNLNFEIEWVEPFAATVNSPEATKIVSSSVEQLGIDRHQKKKPFSWSEDFGHFTQQINGAMFGLGAGIEQPALHAESYDFPDDILKTGISMFMQIINEVTNRNE